MYREIDSRRLKDEKRRSGAHGMALRSPTFLVLDTAMPVEDVHLVSCTSSTGIAGECKAEGGHPVSGGTALCVVTRCSGSETQKPMPPISSPPGAAGAAFSGLSAMTTSVVRNSAAMDAAFCSAERVTLAGSMIPSAIRSTYSPLAAFRPQPDG